MKDLSRVLEAVMKIIISIKHSQPSVAILWLSDTNFNLLEMLGMWQYLFSGSEQAALGASAHPKKTKPLTGSMDTSLHANFYTNP